MKWLLEHLRVLQGRTGFTSSLWCRTEKCEASGQNWVKLHQIAGQKWQLECAEYLCRPGWSLRLPLQWGSARQDYMHFSGLWAAFTGYCLPNPKPCMNHQMCKPAACGRAHSPLLTPWLYSMPRSTGSFSPKIFNPQISAFALLKQNGGRPRSVYGSWSHGENFLCIRWKFLLALTAICAFTAWVPRQLFFLCWVLCLLLFTLQSPGLYFFFIS